MESPASIPYEYVEDKLFDIQANELGLTPKHRDEALRGCLFVIARVPTEFPCIEGTNMYRAVFKLPTGEVVRIWFQFDGNLITLKAIEKMADNESD